MSDTDGLSAPGSSIYSSSTMYVGDGTWDSSRNSFLLPNLVGLNFDTMQYNGMGNRFRDLPQYHSLILGHGVVAAITFIVIVPAAIFTAKYGHWDRQNSYKLHVYLQILTVFLSTVVLVLGWFAVGPERSLTNPHHGIGVALYTLVLFQFIFGWMMSRIERRRKVIPTKIPLKVWLHKLLGRSIALLGFVQIALGLTLYGSPKALFVLYALSGALLLFAYLALDYYYKDRIDGPPPPRPGPGGSEYYSEYDSYVSGTQMTQDQRRHEDRSHWGRNLLAGAGALGAYEAWKHRRERRRQERLDGRVETVGGYDTPGRPRPPPGDSAITPVTPSRPPAGRRSENMPPHTPYGGHQSTESRESPQSWEDEKYTSPQRHTWRNRILGAGAGVAALEGARRLFRGRRKDDDSYDEDYRPPHGGNHSAVSQADVSRVDAGHAPFSPDDPRHRHNGMEAAGAMTPTRRPGGTQHNDAAYDEESYVDEDRPHTFRDSIAMFGALGAFQNWMSQRRSRREQSRMNRMNAQDEINADKYNRRTSMNYPRPSDGRRPSMSDTVMTGTTPDQFGGTNAATSNTNVRPDVHHPPLPAAAAAIPAAAIAGTALGSRHDLDNRHHIDSRHNLNDSRHNIANSGPDFVGSRPNLTDGRHNANADNTYMLPPPPPGPPPGSSRTNMPPIPGSAHMPSGAVEPDPARLLASNTAANESSAYGRGGTAEAGAAGLAAGMLAGRAGRTQSQSPSRYQSRERMQRQEAVTGSSGASETYPPAGTANSPPISLKLKMHNDSGGHVTLRRLNEDEAAAERSARAQERRRRRRRNSSLSSGLEDEPSQRYRRNGPVVPSASQPLTSVPPPPAMSSAAGSARRDSELNLPPAQQQASPPVTRPPYPPSGSGIINPVGSPGAYATDAGTDVSAFDENRRRRRAERARRQQAGQANRVEFE